MAQNVRSSNWSIKKLGDIFTLSAGGDVDKSLFSEKQDAQHPYPIYANALTDRGLYGYSSDYRVEQESITITGRGDIGKVFYRVGKYTPIVRLVVGIPKEGISAKYMSYACSQIRFFNETTGVPQLTVPQVSWYKVAVPPLDEQEKISRILSCWDDAIEQMQNLIAEKKELKRGLMQQLLTGKIRFPGFAYIWENQKLGNMCIMFSGGTPSIDEPEYYGGTIPFIRSAEINSDRTELFLTDAGIMNSSAKLVKNGDLLYALYGATSGEVGIAKMAGAINQAILCIRSETINIKFLYYVLQNRKNSILSKYLQGGQGNLSAQIMKKLHIVVPPMEEQRAIADILMTADEEINLLNKKLDVLKEQKKGLMQKLLTGEIRVKV